MHFFWKENDKLPEILQSGQIMVQLFHIYQSESFTFNLFFLYFLFQHSYIYCYFYFLYPSPDAPYHPPAPPQ